MQEFAQRFQGVEGSAIRKIFDLLTDPEIISFAGGNPNPSLFPSALLAEISSELIAEKGGAVLQYGSTFGWPELRSLLKVRNSAIMKDYDDLITLSGSSQGIEIFTRTFINPGDALLVESPTFLGALQTFFLAEANVQMVDLLDDGPSVEMLEQKIVQYKPKFFYTIPTFQNPSGITMSAAKRQAVYDLCKKYGVMILEDDPYAELRYDGDPLPSIKSLDDSALVCKLSSFSKTISPGLRVGYAIAHKDIIHKFNLVKQGEDVHTSNLGQAMVYEFLMRGYYEPHVRGLCAQYKKHRDAMLDAIGRHFPPYVEYTRPQGGLFIWAVLPELIPTDSFFNHCIECKVAFVPGAPFYADGSGANHIRMNFSMPSIPDIETGVERMGRIIREFA